jgi:O-antigen/teichoic acid export membrane protein
MMQKKFLSSLGLLLLLNALVKPLYLLGIDAEVQNRLGREDYGIYFALLNLSFIFNILIDLGINNFNNRNISQNQKLIGKHFSKLLTAKSLLSFIYALITLLLGFVLGYKEGNFWMLGVLVFNQVMVSFILFARSNLAALQLFKRDGIVSVLDRSLLILFCSILLFTQLTDGRFEAIWFVYLQTLAYFLTLIFALVMVGPKAGKLRWNFDYAFSVNIFGKSLPYALLILSGSIYSRIDGLMLENLLEKGSYHAGNYAQGFRFYEAAGMFAFLFAVLLLPIFSRMLQNKEEVRSMVELSSRMLVGVGVAAAILFFYHSDWLLRWRYTNVDEEAVQSFIALMFGFLGVCMFYIYGTLMTANGNLRALNYISFSGLAINIVFNLILIPKYMAFGAAVTTMFTQLFAGLAQLIFVVIHFRFGINYRMLGQFALFAMLFVTFNHYLPSLIENQSHQFLLAIIAGGALLVLSGTLRLGEIIRLVKAER